MSKEPFRGPLAVEGGTPVIPPGPPDWPKNDPLVWNALNAAYQSGDWGRYAGHSVPKLSEALTRYHQVDHVLPCCSGTVAVELALRAVGVKAGEEVVLAAYDFPGNFRAVEAVGARPVLVDIDAATWCLDPQQLACALSPDTKAVIVSHLHGGLANMRVLCELARESGLAVVEDACQAPGAVAQGRRAGTWGDVGVLSFGGSKLLTAGRGGALLTNDPRALQRARVFCQRGNDAFPLSELQAAVLLPQLGQLDQRNRLRLASVERLTSALRGESAIQPAHNEADAGTPSYYKLGWWLRPGGCGGRPRADVIAALQAEGLSFGEGFRGFHRRGATRCRHVGQLPVARTAAESTLLLHHPVLLEPPEMIDRVAHAMKKVMHGLAN